MKVQKRQTFTIKHLFQPKYTRKPGPQLKQH